MSPRFEVEVILTSAKDLKNVNWRYGPNKPYAVVWVDQDRKVSSRVDDEGDTHPRWDHTLIIPLDYPIEDANLYIDVVHAHAEGEDTKPLIGSAKLPLREVVDSAGIDSRSPHTLKLKRPSGRPQGKLEVEVCVREPRYHVPASYGAQPYGVNRETGYGGSQYAESPAGYPYSHQGYGQPVGYEQSGGYGYGDTSRVEEKKSKFGGMGTGLAVGAVAGVIGGVALAEGFDQLEDHIADEAAERVEDDQVDGDFDGGDDY